MQALGERLIDLTDQQLEAIDTDAELLEHVRAARKMSSHGALRRQKQLIGKKMREVDPEPIRQALTRFGRDAQLFNALFRQAEHWRDRIVETGRPALAEFATATGCASESLERCLTELHNARNERQQKHARRQLFREVHRLMTAKMHNGAV